MFEGNGENSISFKKNKNKKQNKPKFEGRSLSSTKSR